MRSEGPSIDLTEVAAPDVLELCKKNRWDALQQLLWKDPLVATTRIVMNNRITTTVLHQLIYAKGQQDSRAKLIRCILKKTPLAASIPNGFGSLPIHVIAQRNTNLSAATKEALISDLLNAYPQSLVIAGGKGKRTPLHILFTDYVSLELASEMIQKGKSACFVPDKHGFLPIHIACSRHCSPDKLELLLEVHPASLYAVTHNGSTPLSLAESTATKSHPNYTLILHLKKELARAHKAQSSLRSGFPVPISPETNRGISSVAPGTPVASGASLPDPQSSMVGGYGSPLDHPVVDLFQPFYVMEDVVDHEPLTEAAADLLMHLSYTTAYGV